MGNPPQYIITRKLVKRFFKQYLPNKPDGGLGDSTPLYDCWQRFGIDHPSCLQLEDKVGNQSNMVQQYKKKIESMRIKQNVMSKINRPVFNASQRKGKYREDWVTKQWSIYDGLRH